MNGNHLINGKNVLITGAGSGIGRQLSRRFYKEGCSLILTDIDEEALQQVYKELLDDKDSGKIPVIIKRMDVSREQDVADTFMIIGQKFKHLDVVISNAGIVLSGAIDDFELEKWEKVIDVNLIGAFLLAKYAARMMKKQRDGVFLQINSKSGKVGSYKNTAYSSSKFGGIGLIQSLALELAEYNVRCNAICPGSLFDGPLWVNSLFKQYANNWGITEQEVREKFISKIPLGRGCSEDDVCNMAIFLSSDLASYITGQAINITGGEVMH